MKRIALTLLGVGALTCLLVCDGLAMGKKYDDDEMSQNYPDYNKMEMRRKTPPAEPEASTTTPTAPPPLRTSPSLNPPPASNEEELKPREPPKPVFLPDDASEPPLPDDIKETLIQGTTKQ